MIGQTVVRVFADAMKDFAALSVRICVDGHASEIRQMMEQVVAYFLRDRVCA